MLIKFLDGTEREIADLSGANLYGANLYGANLYGADLSGADLSGADLSGADLSGADLYGADLYGANLRNANLRNANLRNANLRNADLRDANLRNADLRGADLSCADLSCADLHGADLRGADLHGANLRGANLRGANLEDCKGLTQFQVCPELGAFIAFKMLASGAIATLLIPADAKRVNAYGSRKCRAEFVYVQQLDVPSVDKHEGKTQYVQGTRVECDKFDPDPRIECSGGIHFFMTRQEASDY